MKRLVQIFRQIDTYLPVAFFALLLSVQGLVSAGAADSLVFPQLIGPDGRALTFADICNLPGQDGDAAEHCDDCSLDNGSALPAPSTVSFSTQKPSLTGLPRPARFLPSTPERWQYFRRGPPTL